MSGETIVIIEMVLSFGLVIGWGFWELHKLRQYKDKDGKDR